MSFTHACDGWMDLSSGVVMCNVPLPSIEYRARSSNSVVSPDVNSTMKAMGGASHDRAEKVSLEVLRSRVPHPPQ
jgi:hypothetical protein